MAYTPDETGFRSHRFSQRLVYACGCGPSLKNWHKENTAIDVEFGTKLKILTKRALSSEKPEQTTFILGN